MLVMRPVWLNIYDHAVVPFENDQITLTLSLIHICTACGTKLSSDKVRLSPRWTSIPAALFSNAVSCAVCSGFQFFLSLIHI